MDPCCGAQNLEELQEQIADWARYNFGELQSMHQFLGVVEEVGELAHAILKREQGIRGTPEEHLRAEKDAVGDIGIFLMNFATSRGLSFEQVLRNIWADVKRRDFRKFPKNGLTE